ncbi:MAG: S-layer homology domain-containing protein [Dialister invisus]
MGIRSRRFLSDQNIVEGYPDGTFKGERNMTRYEMAQITARLLAKETLFPLISSPS